MILSWGFSLALSAASMQAGPASEFIFTSAPFLSCHASTIVELRKRRFASRLVWRPAEGKPDVAIWGARRTGGHWSGPFQLAREPETPTWNPVLFYSRDGRLLALLQVWPSPAPGLRGECGARTMAKRGLNRSICRPDSMAH